MTGKLSSRAKRWLGERVTRKRRVACAFIYCSLLTAFFVCAWAGNSHANAGLFANYPQIGRAPAAHFTSLLAIAKGSAKQRFLSLLRCPPPPAILNMLADVRSSQDITGSVPMFRFGRLPAKPLFPVRPYLPAALTAPTAIGARSGSRTPAMFVGIASTYDPTDPDDNKDCGGLETASGELYDEEGWTAAIRIDLRDRFGGVRYGNNYRPAYALVEAGKKRIIIKVNDVGPLLPHRIIDLNRRAMHYFDPTLALGLIEHVRVTPLPGPYWTAGPIGDDHKTMRLATVATP